MELLNLRVVLIALTLVLMFTSVPAASASPAKGPCNEKNWLHVSPQQSTPNLIAGLIRCAVARWSVSGGAEKAVSVASCESGLDPYANGSGNLGVFQQQATYWLSRVHAFLRPSWFSDFQWRHIARDAVAYPGAAFHARANVLLSIRMAHAGGWGPWSCA